MKKKIGLVHLTENELKNAKSGSVISCAGGDDCVLWSSGGCWMASGCGCGCNYAEQGGSSTYWNARANCEEGLHSPV